MKKLLPNFCILILASSFLFFSCKRDPKPKNALSREKFIAVLVDIHLAEAIHHDRVRYNVDSLNSESLYIAVLQKHNISEEQMKTTTLYYSRHPRDYDKVYSEVLSKYSQMNEEPALTDELKVK
jgi:hypothetical protein